MRDRREATVCWFCHKATCDCRSPRWWQKLLRIETFKLCEGCRICSGPELTQAEIAELTAQIKEERGIP